ncbi:hypothetical protein [Kitasatospora phosalacinea]|uniref:hypothetical protein n=1 Tax=Kitasatospora phosalacinea TaxID=2065 RepID=UPI000524E97E
MCNVLPPAERHRRPRLSRGHGTTRSRSPRTFRNARRSAIALDVIAPLDALRIDRAQQLEPIAPTGEHTWWYQYHFATERGRKATERPALRHDLTRLAWQPACQPAFPTWGFDVASRRPGHPPPACRHTCGPDTSPVSHPSAPAAAATLR